MGQVIALRKAPVRQDLVEHYESMLARAKCGTVDSSVDLVKMKSGKQYISVCGSFADDAGLALGAALRTVEFLRGRAEGEKNDAIQQDYVPAGLRSGWGT